MDEQYPRVVCNISLFTGGVQQIVVVHISSRKQG